jgi:hypothetical protein
MLVKELIFSAVIACTIGMGQAFASTPAEMAKEASAAASASASKAAAWAAEGHQKLQAMEKGIVDLEALITKLQESGSGDTNKLVKAQKDLAKLKAAKARVVSYVAKLDGASAKAAAAAAAAQEALARATAPGVSEADAQAAAGQALRQASKAAQASGDAGKFLNFESDWIAKSGFSDLVVHGQVNNMVTITTTTVTSVPPTTTIPRPGPTPTQVGHGRRGDL